MDYLYANIDADIIDSGEIKFTTVSAEVDNNSGTPSVDVSLRDDTDLHFFFHNLKGDQGVEGPQGEAGVQGPQGIQGAGLGPEGTLPWVKITSVPASYTPSAHTHTISEVDGLQEELNTINSTLETKANSSQLNYKQDKLHVGSNIIIDEKDVISATTDPSILNEIDLINGSIVNINEGLGQLEAGFIEAESRLSTDEDNISTNTTAISNLSTSISTLNSNLNSLSTAVTGIGGNVITLQNDKVDKIVNKGLSTNDYTDSDKTKVSGVESGAQVNKIESIELNGATCTITNKGINLGNLATSDELISYVTQDKFEDFETAETIGDFKEGNVFNLIEDELNNKVDKVINKSLVSDTEIEKLSTVVTGAQPNVIESVILNGSTLTVTNKAVDLGNLVEQVQGKSLVDDTQIEKLETIEAYAQPNEIESIILNGVTLPIENKEVNLGYLVEQEENKGLSTNDFTDEDKDNLDSLKDYFTDSETGDIVGLTIHDVADNLPDEPSQEDLSKLLTARAIKTYIDNKIDPIIQELENISNQVDGIKNILNNL